MVPRTCTAIPRVANSDPIGATDEPGSRSRLRMADFFLSGRADLPHFSLVGREVLLLKDRSGKSTDLCGDSGPILVRNRADFVARKAASAILVIWCKRALKQPSNHSL